MKLAVWLSLVMAESVDTPVQARDRVCSSPGLIMLQQRLCRKWSGVHFAPTAALERLGDASQ